MSYSEWKERFVDGVDISDKNDIIRSIDVDDFEMMADGRNIDKEVSDTIINTIKAYEADGGMYISDVHFGDFYDETTGKRALFQVTANARGLTELNINDEVLGGRTIEELNKQIAANPRNIPQNLKEAIIHECGHAKAYYKKSVAEIRAMNDEIADKGVDGISKIAKMDGSECIAEVEVLLYRGSKIPKTAMDLYKRWVK